jgi:hypothetical protein
VKKFLLPLCLLALAGFAAAVFFLRDGNEIATIRGTQDYDARASAYLTLIERVGLKEAQDRLYASGLPFDGQSHLVQHVAGEYAYRTLGIEGIAACTPYFLFACYHSFFIEVMSAEGLTRVPELFSRCKEGTSTGGPIQCAHGIGHGLVAWYGYKDMDRALEACDALGAEDPSFPTYNCLDGVFMENIWAVHDGGVVSKDRWIRADDLSYPCSDSRLQKESWQRACYGNQPSYIYQQKQGDISAVAKFCDAAPETAKDSCFDGLARQLHPLSGGNVAEADRLCSIVGNAAGKERGDACRISIAIASQSVGGEAFAGELCEGLDTLSESCSEQLRSVPKSE